MRALPRGAGTAVLAALCVSLPGTDHGQVTPAPDPHPASSGISLVAATVIPSAAEEVLTLVNDERAKAGCQPVRLDARLTAAATKHSQDMAQNNYFSHVSPSGATFVDRIKAEGYPAPRSENIAAGNATAPATCSSG